MALVPQKPTGVKNPAGVSLAQQAAALAGLSVEAAEARLDIDWSKPLRHSTFYKAVYRPAILRANRLYPSAAISPELKFHSLRHTYASLCVAGGLDYVEVSRFMGHASPSITLGVYTHLFNTDNHSEAMRKLGAMGQHQVAGMDNVIPLRG
ncbi:tyrosine-type recombinase/integrase [Mycolicibacterium elephantis]